MSCPCAYHIIDQSCPLLPWNQGLHKCLSHVDIINPLIVRAILFPYMSQTLLLGGSLGEVGKSLAALELGILNDT